MNVKKGGSDPVETLLICPIFGDWSHITKLLFTENDGLGGLICYDAKGEVMTHIDQDNWDTFTWSDTDTFSVQKRRPSISDLRAENIMPEDTQVIAELKAIAQNHTRMESAIRELADRLPFADETNIEVATVMMRHIN